MNGMDIKELEAIIESVLFAYGQPMPITKLAQAVQLEEEAVKDLIDGMLHTYNFERRGIRLVRLGEHVQLCTRPEYAEYVRAALESKKAPPLSNAALEVLAIIVYNQPVTKSYIEQVRGVECSSVVANLVEKGLIAERGKLDAPGHPILYGTTPHFLRCFGIESLEDLPSVTELLEKNAGDEKKVEAQ